MSRVWEVRLPLDRVYPFAQIATAHEYSKSGRAKGKIVLEM